MCFFRKRKEKKRALKAEQERLAQEQELKAVQPEKVAQTPPPPVKETPKESVKPVEKVKAEPVVETPKEEAPVEKAVKSKSATPPKYHVSQNKDEGSENFKKWRVRKEGSTKTIKFFDTQKEAIAYAEDLAENAGSSVVIHKIDGSIRKQDYSKKA